MVLELTCLTKTEKKGHIMELIEKRIYHNPYGNEVKWDTRVVRPGEAEKVRVHAQDAEVEIRAAFNDNLVIQSYKGGQKIILLYLPDCWNGKVEIVTDIAVTAVCMPENSFLCCKEIPVDMGEKNNGRGKTV